MRKLVCKPSDRSVCCDIEGYEEEAVAESDNEDSEAEAEGDHEDSEAEAEGNYEEANPEAEGDHEESDAEAEGSDHDDQNKITNSLGNFTILSEPDFLFKFLVGTDTMF